MMGYLIGDVRYGGGPPEEDPTISVVLMLGAIAWVVLLSYCGG